MSSCERRRPRWETDRSVEDADGSANKRRKEADRKELDTRGVREHDHPYKAKLEQIEKDLSLLTDVVQNLQKVVSFTAHPNTAFSTGNSIIPFPTIVSQKGDSFDGSTGVFTAKIPGVYYFSASLQKDSVSHLQFRIYKNDSSLCRGYDTNGNDSYNMVTCSATIKLDKNDRVSVFLYTGKLTSGHYSTFTGFLI